MHWGFSLLASAMVVACAICAPAKAQVIEQPGGDVQWVSGVPQAPSVSGTKAEKAGSADAVYSNLGTFRNQSFAAGGATVQGFNTITRMAADDLNLVGTPPYQVNGFRFTVTNLNAVDVSASPLVRFYLPNGPGGSPGTLIAAFSYSPITFTAGRVGTIKTSTRFILPSSNIWAGIVFDNNGSLTGNTGATAAQLDNLAQGNFSPAEVGTSADRYFLTNAAGSFAEDNPVGLVLNFAGGPPADFGWEILTEQDVDLSITVSDGITTAIPGGSVVYTITASNAGPNTVFDARVVDTFPAPLTCSWTCAGSAGNTCAAAGTGNINDATVALAVGGSVTYTATCAVSFAATGTLTNTAAIVAPGTALDRNPANNTATDTDAITVPPPAVTRVTFASLQPNPTLVGQATTATVRVDTSPGNPPPTGLVSVVLSSSGQVLCTITLPATTCTFTPNQTGDTQLIATYSGDAVYRPGISNEVVMSIAPVTPVVTIVSVAPNPTAVGTATTATVTVDTHPLFAPPTGTISVRETNVGTPLCTITLPATSCVFTPTTPGVGRLDAIYAGDANYHLSSATYSQVVAVVGITSAAPPGGVVSLPYSHAYRANGPLAYAVTSGALPPGLALAGDGVLSGTPTTAGTFAGTVTGTGGGLSTSQAFSIAIAGTLPGAPTIGTAAAGNALAIVTFTPPASNGGSPISSYTVTSSPGGIGASGASSPIFVSGLINGTAYTFTVTATNAAGTGPASSASNSVTPATVPGAPTIGVATAGNGQASVSFTPPTSTGGSPITAYTVTSSPGDIVASGAASPITVPGLTNGTAYTFTVTATNVVGPGPASAASNSITPLGVPGAPTIGVATAGNGQATVAFTPPASNGGSPITSYTVTSSPGGIVASGPASPITVSGLVNGTAYTFTVTATNAAGTGPASAASNSVTPATVPGASTIAIAAAGNTQAGVAFAPPASNGGSPITSYTVTSSPGGISASGVASPIIVSGLANGTAYTFTVTATNAVGTGPASAPSNSVTPVAVPGPPTIGTATAGNGQATVAFVPPASSGGSPITSYTVTSSPSGISASGPASPITVTGLANGTAYTFTVTATNAVGTGLASAPSNSVTPAGLPGAPTIAIAAAGNTQAGVAFAPPASNGGSPITSYTVISSPGGFSASGALSPIIVSGLANGTAYTFTVTATNAVGTGPASAPSNSVTPAAVPGPPTIGTATAGNAQATVTFTPPASSGGAPITSYTVTSAPGGISASGAASPIIVTGLANGTAYTFTVTATNAVGTGLASAPSNSVTPPGVPGAPTIGTATPGNGQATVAFTPPASTGGSPITLYTVTSSPGGIVASGPAAPIRVTGLANGTAYTFTVTATNAAGTGPASAASNSVTPGSVPGAPTIGTATPGNTQAAVAFTPPASNGGSAITSYTVSSSPGGITASGAASPIVVGGLTNGTAYTFTVAATNGAGTGPASAPSNSVTPAGVPGAPTIGTATAGNGQATVAFTPPASSGGSPITSYTVISSPGGIAASGPASPITVTGLANGTTYTFTVRATNAAGIGLASAPSNSVTPLAVPGAPTIGAARAGNGQAGVSFTAPASNGGSPITSYTATSSPGGITASGPASPLIVSGLANGTVYTFTVTATNAVGTGPPSGASNSVTPLAVPGAPTIGAATAGNGQASVSFTPPASSGGSPITSYTATSSPGDISASGPASPITVAGLTNGTAYTFTVTATNAQGTGLESAASNSVTPVGAPGAPRIRAALPGNGLAVVLFAPPLSDGGSPITGYTATCDAFSATAAGSPIIVTGLTNGAAYSCSVTATNSQGTGPASASMSVTPVAITTFSGPSATGTGTITASFTGGGGTCTFAAPQFIGIPPGEEPIPPTAPEGAIAFPHGLFDFSARRCTAGSTLTFTITYPAVLPAGAQYWKYGPTATNTAPHWYVLPATITGNTASFAITDGGLGDDDLVANGTIVDQGGPGVPGVTGLATAVPTLSEWMLGLLAALLLAAAAAIGIPRPERAV